MLLRTNDPGEGRPHVRDNMNDDNGCGVLQVKFTTPTRMSQKGHLLTTPGECTPLREGAELTPFSARQECDLFSRTHLPSLVHFSLPSLPITRSLPCFCHFSFCLLSLSFSSLSVSCRLRTIVQTSSCTLVVSRVSQEMRNSWLILIQLLPLALKKTSNQLSQSTTYPNLVRSQRECFVASVT
jgi:hypothetical protein